MTKEDIKVILEKIGTTELTVEEQAKVDLWLFQLHQWEATTLSDKDIKLASSRIWDRLEALQLATKPVNTHRLWRRWATVAAISVSVLIGSLFFLLRQGQDSNVIKMADKIVPGKEGATLMLADGRIIAMNEATEGSLARELGVIISKGPDGQLIYEIKETGGGEVSYNTLSTGRGEHTKLRLPDGSLVYLNASSSLRYPTSFTNTAQRKVSLMGEGYFEVTKDKNLPFVVQTQNQEIAVLGTHFNVNTYEVGKTITTLEEGAVRIDAGDVGTVIKPGQQAVNTGGQLLVQEADLAQVLGWKDGDFVFTGNDIQTVMHQLERWYDIEVVYEGPVVNGLFYANISRTKALSEVLNILEKTNGVHFKIKERRVIVSR